MIKNSLWIIAVIGLLVTGCISKPADSSGGITLDQAIAEAAKQIDERIEAKTKIALLNFSSPSDRFSVYVLDELTANLLDSGKMIVVDRKEVDLIRSEFEFQFSGDVGDDSMQELGRMLGAQFIVSGSLTEIGGDYRIVIRVLNVQTAAVAVQYRADISADRRVLSLLEGGRSGGAETAGRGQVVNNNTEQLSKKTESSIPDNFVRVEGGTFQMGTVSGGNDDERPVRQVTLKSFNMSKYPVTQKEWYEIMGTTVRQQRDMIDRTWSIYGEGDNYPMYYVNWHEAIEYCNRRSQREGLIPVYSGSEDNIICNWNANGYRLPTEAEWEYTAKGGNTTMLLTEYSGSNSVETVAWYDGNSGNSTKPVGTRAPNSLGIFDMSGNVWEWCWDWYGTYPSGAQTDPHGASAKLEFDGFGRVIRGGSWGNFAAFGRSAHRNNSNPTDRGSGLGFRVVRN